MTAATSPGSFTKNAGSSMPYSTTSAPSPHSPTLPPYASLLSCCPQHKFTVSLTNPAAFRPTRSSANTCSTQTRQALSQLTRTTSSPCSAEKTLTSRTMLRASQALYSSVWAPRNPRSLRRLRLLLRGKIFLMAVHPRRAAPRVFLGLGSFGSASWFCARRILRWLYDSFPSFLDCRS